MHVSRNMVLGVSAADPLRFFCLAEGILVYGQCNVNRVVHDCVHSGDHVDSPPGLELQQLMSDDEG